MNALFVLSNNLENRASLRLLLFLSLLMVILAVLILSPISPSEELIELAHGQNVPDAQFWRPAAAFYQQLVDYGLHGRQLYLSRIVPVDLFIPIGQAMFLSIAIALVWRRLLAADSRWQLLNLIPFLAMIGDYLENISLVSLTLIFPIQVDIVANLAAIFTVIKFAFTIISIALIALGLLLRFMRRSN